MQSWLRRNSLHVDGSMTRGASEVVVLVEDRNQLNFVRRFLKERGYSGRIVRNHPLPIHGSGEQWVRRAYPSLLREVRQRARGRRAATALVVAIDADVKEVDERIRQLEDSLKAAREPARDNQEFVALLVPKRNIETWILCLRGDAVDEAQDYKNRVSRSSWVLESAVEFAAWIRLTDDQLPVRCIASMRRGLLEGRRVPVRKAG